MESQSVINLIAPQEFTSKSYTLAHSFIRPMMGYPTQYYGPKYCNTYIDPLNELIHIVFKRPLKEDFTQYYYTLESLMNDVHYKEAIDTEEFLVLIFNVPEDCRRDFQLFIDGKYSQMSTDYKEHILSTYVQDQKLYQWVMIALYPKDYHRNTLRDLLGVSKAVLKDDCEVLDKPRLQEEVFSMDKIKIKKEENVEIGPIKSKRINKVSA